MKSGLDKSVFKMQIYLRLALKASASGWFHECEKHDFPVNVNEWSLGIGKSF